MRCYDATLNPDGLLSDALRGHPELLAIGRNRNRLEATGVQARICAIGRIMASTTASRFSKPNATDINVVAIVKNKTAPHEYFIFLYDDANKSEILRQAGQWAANPELSFSWYDAAVASQKIRGEEKG